MPLASNNPRALARPPPNRIRDKALLIGIQYEDPAYPGVSRLRNPHEDVRLLKDYLMKHEGYLEENITTMMDVEGVDSQLDPTRDNILKQIALLVKDVKAGDNRVFFFGGHGCQLINRRQTEKDGLDECVLPKDHNGWPVDKNEKPLPTDLPQDHPDHAKRSRVIVDNEFREFLVNPLPPGSQLVAFFETCHSGTILDLDSTRWGNRCTDIMTYVPKGYRVVKKGILGAAVSVFSPLDFLPQSFPGMKLVNRHKMKRDPSEHAASPATASLQRPKMGHKRGASNEGWASIISFSSSDDGQRTFDIEDKTMIRVVVQFLEEHRKTSPQKSVTPAAIGIHIHSRMKAIHKETYDKLAFEKPLKFAKIKLSRWLGLLQIPQVTSFDPRVLKQPLQL